MNSLLWNITEEICTFIYTVLCHRFLFVSNTTKDKSVIEMTFHNLETGYKAALNLNKNETHILLNANRDINWFRVSALKMVYSLFSISPSSSLV